MGEHAVPQVHVDQALIGHPSLHGQALEIGNGIKVKADGDLSLEQFRVGILLCFGKVVILSHNSVIIK